MALTSIAELTTNLVWDRTNSNLKLGGAAASANATLVLLGTKTIAAPASGSAWNALDLQASTLTLAAGGAAPNELAAVRFAAPVITAGGGSAYVVPVAATVIIDGPPVTGASGGATPTLTAVSALLVKGNTRVTSGALHMSGYGGVAAAAAIFFGSAGTDYLYRDGVTGAITLRATGADFHFTSGGAYSGAAMSIGTTHTHTTSLKIVATRNNVPSAADAAWDGINFAASTLTLTGSTQCNASINLVNIAAPTITDASAVTVDKAATVYIAGPPVAAGSVTLTETSALVVASGRVKIVGTGLANVSLQVGDGTVDTRSYFKPSGVYAIGLSNGAGNYCFLGTAATSDPNFYVLRNAGSTMMVLAPDGRLALNLGNTTEADIGSFLHVKASKSLASAAGVLWDGINFDTSTLTLTGSTQCNASLNFVTVEAPTITDASAVTVDYAATVYISGPPVAAGSVTLTDSYSFRVASGSARFDGRILGAQGADVTAANDITLGNGNYFDLTGATEVQRILGTGWTAGSIVTLQFDANPNVKHNTAAGGGYYGFQLAGAGDFAASAGDTLTLRFDGAWWREIGRTVI